MEREREREREREEGGEEEKGKEREDKEEKEKEKERQRARAFSSDDVVVGESENNDTSGGGGNGVKRKLGEKRSGSPLADELTTHHIYNEEGGRGKGRGGSGKEGEGVEYLHYLCFFPELHHLVFGKGFVWWCRLCCIFFEFTVIINFYEFLIYLSLQQAQKRLFNHKKMGENA